MPLPKERCPRAALPPEARQPRSPRACPPPAGSRPVPLSNGRSGSSWRNCVVSASCCTIRISPPRAASPGLIPNGPGLAPNPNAGQPAVPQANGTQFAPTGGAATVVVPRTNVQVDEQSDRRMAVVRAGVSLQELVNNLNSLGVGPRDM